jgi:hypothetical protein
MRIPNPTLRVLPCILLGLFLINSGISSPNVRLNHSVRLFAKTEDRIEAGSEEGSRRLGRQVAEELCGAERVSNVRRTLVCRGD